MECDCVGTNEDVEGKKSLWVEGAPGKGAFTDHTDGMVKWL